MTNHNYDNPYNEPVFRLGISILIFLSIIAIAFSCFSETSVPEKLWLGVIAEAGCNFRNPDFDKEITAIVFCVKNRLEKKLGLGLCAMKKKTFEISALRDLQYINSVSKKDYEKILKEIIQKVFSGEIEDITKGATHYENIEVFGVPYWAKKMTVTAKVGSHTFYR